MAKKQDRYIYNIDNVNVEIDYDKLAEAIVKANEKQSKQYSVSSEWMKFIITPVFWCTSIASGILAVVFWIYGCKDFLTQINTKLGEVDWVTFAVSFSMICIGFFLASLCIFTAATAKEIDKEKDRGYIATMFSNIVALVALVVSLIALVKG